MTEECCDEEAAVSDDGALVDLLLWSDAWSVSAMLEASAPGMGGGCIIGAGGCGERDGRCW